jgi:hypothetical protein
MHILVHIYVSQIYMSYAMLNNILTQFDRGNERNNRVFDRGRPYFQS